MRERMEKLVLLPFTIGCVSESSIAVGAQQQPRRSKSDTNPSPIRTKEEEEEEEEEDGLSGGESMKNSFRSLAIPKPNISIVYKDEMEEMEMDMEIGCPTDVKHVTHIGLDGSASAATTDPIKGTWDGDLISPVSWRQFELSRPSQADADALAVVNDVSGSTC